MTTYTDINLQDLPAPDAIKNVDYESILQTAKDKFAELSPETTALQSEADPSVKNMEVASYLAMGNRQEVNDGVRAVMVAFSKGSDLDHLAVPFHLKRLVIDPGDPDATPPIAPTMESDDDFRERIAQSPEGYSVAGPRGAYEFHAGSASGDVKDVLAENSGPAQVTVTVLSHTGNGTASSELLDTVAARLNDEDVRPLGDQVTLQSAGILEYSVVAELSFYNGPDKSVVFAEAQNRLNTYIQKQHRLGGEVVDDGIKAALRPTGVKKVNLSDWSDIVAGPTEAPYCINVTVSMAGA